MVAGTGDAAVDVANVADFENLRAIKSEAAAAMMKWSALQQLAPPTPTPTPTPTPAAAPKPRNGTALAYGVPAY